MNQPSVLVETSGPVALLRLNRPQALNSFNREMARRLQQEIRRSASRPEIRALLLTGQGRAFSAGQDLKETPPPDAPPATIQALVMENYTPLIRLIRETEKPFVCAVNGVAAGASANLALACDFVLASEQAAFIQSFIRIGLIPDAGGTFLLPRLVGMAQATAMAMLGEAIPAHRALEMGLIYQACPGAQLQQRALALAGKLAQMPTRALGLAKRALNASLGSSLTQQLELEARLQAEAAASGDYREGVEAFLQKREPRFHGS